MKQPFMSTAPIMEGEVPELGGNAVMGTFSGTIWDLSLASEGSKKFIAAYKKSVRKQCMPVELYGHTGLLSRKCL